MSNLFTENQELNFSGFSLRVERLLATGLTSEVYLGTLEGPEEPVKVAIKAMKKLEFPLARDLFKREGQVLQLLMEIEKEEYDVLDEDLKIAPLYYGGMLDQEPLYLVMEFIEGKQLPQLLLEQGRLPELQALIIAWHLYRILYLLHTQLSFHFIDLKFENLWWIDKSDKIGGGQLKVTDFGTLEEITPTRTQGIQRDILLAGVYFFALLTGYVLHYSLGEIKERAEPLIQKYQENFSQGVRRILRRLLHRNPKARYQSAQEVLNDVRQLVEFWTLEPEKLQNQVLRYLQNALEIERSSKTALEARQYAEMAEAALDILRLRQGGLSPELEEIKKQVRELLVREDYLQRGLELLRGSSFTNARKIFEEGINFSENPVQMRHWTYVASIGEELSPDTFQVHLEDIKSILDTLHDPTLASRPWQIVRKDLENLKNPIGGKPSLASRGLQYLIDECLLYEKYEEAKSQEARNRFAEAAQAYQEVDEILRRLPASSQKLLEEELGPLAAKERVARIKAEEEEARRYYQEASEHLQSEDVQESTLLQKIRLAKEKFPDPAFHVENLALLGQKILERAGSRKEEFRSLLKLFYQVIDQANYYPQKKENALYASLFRLGFYLKQAEQSWNNRNVQAFNEALSEIVGTARGLQELSFLQAWFSIFAEEAIRERNSTFLQLLVDISSNESLHFPELDQWKAKLSEWKEQELQQRRALVDEKLCELEFLLFPLRDHKMYAEWEKKYSALALLALQKPEEPLSRATQILDLISPLIVDEDQATKTKNLREEVEQRKNELKSARGETNPETKVNELQREFEELKRSADQLESVPKLRNFLYRCYALRAQGINDADLGKAITHTIEMLSLWGIVPWAEIIETATQQKKALEQAFTEARKMLEEGQIEQVSVWLDESKERYSRNSEWKELWERVKIISAWKASQTQLLSKLETDASNQAFLELYEFRHKLPPIYWEDARHYLENVKRSQTEQLKRSRLESREFFEAMCNLLRVHWLLYDGEKKEPWSSWHWLQKAYEKARSSQQALFEFISQTPPPPDEQVAQLRDSFLDFDQWQSLNKEWERRVHRARRQQAVLRWVSVVAGVLLLLLTGGGGAFMYIYTHPSVLPQIEQQTFGTYTPTTTPTSVPSPTPLPTPTPTLLPTSTPSPTPVPPSAFVLSFERAANLQPDLPVLDGEAYWLLNDTEAVFFPPLDSKTWESASLVYQGVLKEPFYYADSGEEVSVTWRMDQPFDADGYYQLFLLDPITNSGGLQPLITVRADGQTITPWRGQAQVILQTQGQQQGKDAWRSLGIYSLRAGQRIEVEVKATNLSATRQLGADRLLIARLNSAMRQIVDALPQGRVLVSLLDDRNAEFRAFSPGSQLVPIQQVASEQIFSFGLSWNGSMHAFPMPDAKRRYANLQVDWLPMDRVPAGTYEVYVWIPAEHASAVVEYRLIVADGGKPVEVKRDAPAVIRQADWPGQWVSLGTWKLDKEANIGLRLIAETAKAQGEVGIDAVAILRVGE